MLHTWTDVYTVQFITVTDVFVSLQIPPHRQSYMNAALVTIPIRWACHYTMVFLKMFITVLLNGNETTFILPFSMYFTIMYIKLYNVLYSELMLICN